MNKKKEYEKPKFELVRTDESNKVFFAASGGLLGSIAKMTSTSATSW